MDEMDEARRLGRMLAAFNREFGSPTPIAEEIAALAAPQLASGEIAVVFAEDDGFAQLRYRRTLYSGRPSACLEELWVRPAVRGRGLGRRLLQDAMARAREHGADRIDLTTTTADVAALSLYRSCGFSNLEDGDADAVMLYLERDLDD